MPIAFIMLTNAIREGAKETFSYFTERGVEIKVISGDNPKTVAEIAEKRESVAQITMWMHPR